MYVLFRNWEGAKGGHPRWRRAGAPFPSVGPKEYFAFAGADAHPHTHCVWYQGRVLVRAVAYSGKPSLNRLLIR